MPAHTRILAAWINLWIWHLPDPDYNRMFYEHYLRSDVLPYTPGC